MPAAEPEHVSRQVWLLLDQRHICRPGRELSDFGGAGVQRQGVDRCVMLLCCTPPGTLRIHRLVAAYVLPVYGPHAPARTCSYLR